MFNATLCWFMGAFFPIDTKHDAQPLEDKDLSPDDATDSSVQYWLDTHPDRQSKKENN